jgi:dipeptidyl aminopeptidase/acylaminoacyl peptidase
MRALFRTLSCLPALVVFACEPASTLPPASPPPAPPAAAPASAPAASPPPATAYSGHGASSIPPEILAKYAPTPIDAAVKRRIESMLDLRAPGAGIPSADGKHLFFNWSITGTVQVWRLDAANGYPIEMTGGADQTRVVGVLPDGKTIVVQRDRNGEENPGLYLESAPGGPLTVIQHKPGVQTQYQFSSDDGRWVYFRANDVKPSAYAIYRFDPKSGARETVFDQEGIWNIADHKPDGTLLLAKETGGSSAEIFEWDPTKKALRPLFGQGETEDWSAAYGAAPGEVIGRAPHGGDFYRLWRWKDGTFTPLTPDVKHDVDTFLVDEKRLHLLYTVNEDGLSRLYAMDPRTPRPIALPKLPEGEQVSVGATSPGGARFVTLSVTGARMPSTSFVLDWTTGKASQWLAPNTPEINVGGFAKATIDAFPARDGTKIPYVMRKPAACEHPDKPCPVVVVFHGGPEGQAVPTFSGTTQLFVDDGFIVVAPNVRGSTGYGRAWLHADDGAKRLQIITDIEDAAKYFRTAFTVNGAAPKVGIFGGSYGGYSTLMGMTMFAGAYDAGVEIVGISNLVTFIRNTAPYRRILRSSEYGDPDKGDLEVMTKLSPMTYLDRVKSPLMLIQGASDPRVPAGEAIQIHDALASRGIEAPLVIFPDEGHGAAKRENQVLQWGYALSFFEKHLR